MIKPRGRIRIVLENTTNGIVTKLGWHKWCKSTEAKLDNGIKELSKEHPHMKYQIERYGERHD